jgi:hypothetical protein
MFEYKLCLCCGHLKHGTSAQKKRQDQVFEHVDFFLEEFDQDGEIIDSIHYDQQDPSLDSSTKARPDIRIVTAFRTIIIEVDEGSHLGDSYICMKKMLSNIASKEIERMTAKEKKEDRKRRRDEKENARLNDIASSGNVSNIVFIRFSNIPTYSI